MIPVTFTVMFEVDLPVTITVPPFSSIKTGSVPPVSLLDTILVMIY